MDGDVVGVVEKFVGFFTPTADEGETVENHDLPRASIGQGGGVLFDRVLPLLV